MPYSLFAHGLESSSLGTKATFFKERFPEVVSPDFTGPFQERMAQLREVLSDKDELILVGSSYGGLLCSVYACEFPSSVRKLILLAPALSLSEFAPCMEKKLLMPTVIYHGTKDEVVPLEPVKKIALGIFKNLTFNEVDDEHRLQKTFLSIHWKELLET